MKRIGVTANCLKPHAPGVLNRLARKAAETGLTLVACDATAEHLPEAERSTETDFPCSIDLLMALGGDGTMLRAVRMIEGGDIPVLGVNLGSLGFMTSVTEERLEQAVDVLVAGTYSVSQRTAAQCRLVRDGATVSRHRALNDMVIGWGASSRVVTLALHVGGSEVGDLVCDGLIVSTPTGSTGHSLSAGGPIVLPESPVFVLSPICPHTLSNRAMVVPDDAEIRIVVKASDKQQLFVIDGQDHFELVKGDEVHVTRAPHRIRFVHLPGYSYFSVLRHKLHWRGSNV